MFLNNYAYFDYAATAPLRPEAADAMQKAPQGNPASLHSSGKLAAQALEKCRVQVARLLHAKQPAEIIFTSGGTESDNTAMRCLVPFAPRNNKKHVIISAIEHDAVLNSAATLKERGYIIHELKPSRDGVVCPKELENLIISIEDKGEKCALVSVHFVNNELGTIQPINELCAIAHKHDALFFTDAVQALGKLEINLEELGVDAAAFSAHKIAGPKGIGALYVNRKVKMRAFMQGGGQENKKRSGTVNVAAICGFAKALELAEAERLSTWEHVLSLRKHILEHLDKNESSYKYALVPTITKDEQCVAHTLSLLCDGLDGQSLVLQLDEAGFALSAGSACGAKNLDPSHVIVALGIPKDEAYGSLRISLAKETTLEQVNALLAAIDNLLS